MTIQTRTPMSDPIREKLMKMVDDYVNSNNQKFKHIEDLRAKIDGLFMVEIRKQFSEEDEAILVKHGSFCTANFIHYFKGNGKEGKHTARVWSWPMKYIAPLSDHFPAIKNIHSNSEIANLIRIYEDEFAEHNHAIANAKSPYWQLIDGAITLEEVCKHWSGADSLLIKVRKDLAKEKTHYNKRWALRNPNEWEDTLVAIAAVEYPRSSQDQIGGA